MCHPSFHRLKGKSVKLHYNNISIPKFQCLLQSISDKSFKYIIMFWWCTVLIGIEVLVFSWHQWASLYVLLVLPWVFLSEFVHSFLYLFLLSLITSAVSKFQRTFYLFIRCQILLCSFAEISFLFHKCWKLEKYLLTMLLFSFLCLLLLAMCLKVVFSFLSLPE